MATVYVPTPLRRLTGGEGKVEVNGTTVAELLAALERTFPGMERELREPDGSVRGFINIFVNGTEIRQLRGAQTPLREGDEVSIIPAMAGGAATPGGAIAIYDSVLDVVGHTPLVRWHKVVRGVRAEVVAKLAKRMRP
jgi:molybdopterin synthase sulfur carrier subunit